MAVDDEIESELAYLNESAPDPTRWDEFVESVDMDLSHSAGDIPLPGEVAPQGRPLQSYQGPKASSSFRGITPEGTRKAKGFYAEADRRIDAQSGVAAEVAGVQADKSRAHYGDVGDALDLAIQRTADFQRREQELQDQVIDFNRTAAEVEQRASAQALAERQSYIAAYREQLAVVKQLALQSGNPFGKMGRGEAAGLAGAQFAQGFLAAQGINIDVAGQVDRWVERSIQEHQLKIQNARASAEDQFHLYELSRQNSLDEWEGRQRYRGFVIAGLQAAIHLNASRFQSDIAMARAQEQIARLQVEADSTERAIADKYFDRIHQIATTENQRAFQMGSLAIEQRKAALEADKLTWEKDPRNPKNKTEGATQPETFIDPEGLTNPDGSPMMDPQGNRIFATRWRVKGSLSDKRQAEVAKEAQERVGAYSEFLGATNELQKSYLAAKAARDQLKKGGYFAGATSAASWEVAARLDKTGAIEKFMQDRRTWLIAKIKSDSGLSVTDKERQFHEENLYLDKLLSRDHGAKGEKLYANLAESGRRGFENRMNALPVEPADPGSVEFRPPAAPRTGAKNQAAVYGEEPAPGSVEKLERRALQKDSNDPEREYTAVSGAWADFKNIDYSVKTKGSEAAKDYAKTLGQSEGAVALEMVAAAYAKPSFFYRNASNFGVDVKKNEETPAEIRRGAYKALTDISLGNSPDGRSVPADLMEWAGYLKDQIDNDPELSGALQHDRDVTDSPFAQRLADRPGNK